MQRTLSVSAFLALVASTFALQITAPAEGSTLDLSTDNKIQWSTVSSDPTTVNIVLTNMNVNPPVREEIATNVDTSTGSFDLSSVDGAIPGGNYRINIEGTTANNQGILAQSGQFTVAEAGSSSTSSASFTGSTASTSAIVSTSTITSTLSTSGTLTTITSTGISTLTSSSSSRTSGSSSESHASSTSSSSSTSSGDSAATTGGASSLNTFAGAGVVAMVAALLA